MKRTKLWDGALILLLLALRAEAAWHRLFYQIVPGFGLFRVPARMIYLFVLSTAVLAGLTFDHWFNLPATTFQLWRSHLQRAALLLLPALFLVTLLVIVVQAAQTDQAAQLRLQNMAEQLVRLIIFLALSLALLLKGYGRPRAWLRWPWLFWWPICGALAANLLPPTRLARNLAGPGPIWSCRQSGIVIA
jgi:hypothetical protein